MTTDAETDRKLFSLQEANAMLPLVRAIAQDLSELSKEVIDRRQRLAVLRRGGERPAEDMYGEELQQIETELENDTHRLREYVQELIDLGVEPKNGPEGLIDFPCLKDGRIVYLCWRLGEPEVQFWHETDAGFAGRRPVSRRQKVSQT